jgi:proteic killer suppression protein
MEVRFEDADDLDRLETDPEFTGKRSPAVVKGFRKVMQFIRAAVDERDFYAMKSLHFEKLQGARDHQRSMRLNDQWRLVVELESKEENKVVVVKGIEENPNPHIRRRITVTMTVPVNTSKPPSITGVIGQALVTVICGAVSNGHVVVTLLLTVLPLHWFWPVAEKARLPVMFLAPGRSADFTRIAERHPRLTLIVDHMSIVADVVKADL